jgi:MFS superfamily sulfate permease-like transporter
LTGLARWLPGLALFGTYPREALRGDLIAGLSAFLVMIPSVLAYSELVGVPPAYGLYSAIGAMAGYALFSRGTPVVAGPDATTALLAAAVVAPLAGDDPARTLALATRCRSSSARSSSWPRGCRSATSRTCCPSRCWSAISTARR